MLKAIVSLCVASALAGCAGADGVSTPTAPTSTVSTTQVETPRDLPLSLRGFVTDTAYRPLAGARVEVVDGPSAGVSTIAGDDGQFLLSGTFNAATQFRASKEGHETRTQPWNCSVAVCLGANNAQPWLGFYLTVLEPTVNIAGDYRLTFIANGACTDLPDSVRTRSYRATVTARPSDGRSTVPGFDLKADGAQFIGILDGFQIGAAGTRLSLWLHGRHDPVIVEDLGGTTYLGFSGTAAATVANDGIVAIDTAFDGWIEHVVLGAPLGAWYFPQPAVISKATCDSSNHRITLMRAR